MALLALRLLTGEPAEMAALQCVLEAAPRYFETITGLPPGGAEAQSTFTETGETRAAAPPFIADVIVLERPIDCGE